MAKLLHLLCGMSPSWLAFRSIPWNCSEVFTRVAGQRQPAARQNGTLWGANADSAQLTFAALPSVPRARRNRRFVAEFSPLAAQSQSEWASPRRDCSPANANYAVSERVVPYDCDLIAGRGEGGKGFGVVLRAGVRRVKLGARGNGYQQMSRWSPARRTYPFICSHPLPYPHFWH